MFRLLRVIIRPSMEQIQDYLSSSCTLGSQAFTVGCINIVKVHKKLKTANATKMAVDMN
jgi:hypothetical protein